MSKRSAGPLILGLLLIAAGVLFLTVNLAFFDVSWVIALKVLFPVLFIYFGLSKLIRHFVWDKETIQQRPGKAGLLGGIFWFSLGAVILLDILGVLDTLDFIGNYWPVVLILYGLLKIADYYRFNGGLQFRTGEVFGIVFLIFFGFGANQLAQAHLGLFDELRWGGFRWPVMYPNDEKKFQFDSSEALEVSDLESVEVINLYGNLKVIAGGDESLEIQLSKVVRGESEKEAQLISDSVRIITEKDGTLLRIRTNREELQEQGKKLNTHITLQLPEKIQVVLKNRYGDVEVERRTANCKIENSYGSVKARSINGDLEIYNRYRPVEIRRVQGSLRVTNRRGSVRVEEVTGDTEITTDYETITGKTIEGNVILRNHFGSIRIDDVKGKVDIEGPGSRIDVKEITQPVSIKNSHKTVSVKSLDDQLDLETSYSKVTVEKIQGLVTMTVDHSDIAANDLASGIKLQGKGSEVSLTQINGPVEVATTLRQARINKFSGPASITNEYGDIVILVDKTTLTHTVTADNTNGEIELILPKSAGFQISAQSDSGEIDSDFGEVESKSDENTSILNTQIGTGGPKFELKTSHSRIRIKKRG